MNHAIAERHFAGQHVIPTGLAINRNRNGRQSKPVDFGDLETGVREAEWIVSGGPVSTGFWGKVPCPIGLQLTSFQTSKEALIGRETKVSTGETSGSMVVPAGGSGRRQNWQRRFPIGAEVAPDGGTHFRVWAPQSTAAAVELVNEERCALNAEGDGYFSGHVQAEAGQLYKIRLDSGAFPDPASRFQPQGPHGPSEIIDGTQFRWTDAAWRGLAREGQVLYELHIGTFTREGTWRAAAEQLPELAGLGITAIELMPVAEFPGRFGWGYDGVDFFAPTHLYGRPDDFRAFVDHAHAVGIGVILDVVYNHLGPDGNFLKHFSADYFTNRYKNEWGDPINFDGENSGPVREFFIANAAYWIDEFHLDGLRLDATQQMFDASPEHILEAITRSMREAAPDRATYVVAENEPQHVRLLREPAQRGFGVDALWNDDFHHCARVALTGHVEAYFSDYRGTAQEFVSAAKWGYLFQGQWYVWQKKRRGTPAFDLHPSQFINYLQNHDQVANSLRGSRIHQLSAPGRYRALTALLLLGPATPMLFQGQEFAASAPFLYFADHTPELARLVAAGRRAFLNQFRSIACPEADAYVNEPHSEDTFTRCKLDFSERKAHEHVYRLHRDLIALRRGDPVFSRPRPRGVDGAVLGPETFVLRLFSTDGADRLLLINLGMDLHLSAAPEPLLAPPDGALWQTHWSSEHPCYGGCGSAPVETEERWRIPGHAAIVLLPRTADEDDNGKDHPPNRSYALAE